MIPTGWLIQREGGLGALQVFGRESEVPFENKVKLEKSESQQCLPLLVSPNQMGLGAAYLRVQIRNCISWLSKIDLTSSSCCFCSAAQLCPTLFDPMGCSNQAPLSSTISQVCSNSCPYCLVHLWFQKRLPRLCCFLLPLFGTLRDTAWRPGGPGEAQVPLYEFNNTRSASVTR